ncbi:DUF4065 domain-containing protein [Sphingomonas sp. SM33]|uniref:DUF4065 domain-containing protein n=1 Tax=Sphingomonas telluris TaxID=2907998 RepID=A0ABS9VQL8_9SPHN|nr:type II toxin-antitoxin system antitoxin SocA domain-containing protein [Sphingomonas telluris]MCH8617278.1 DUF4065 domain-containing protein [Sphingomonas telluris]
MPAWSPEIANEFIRMAQANRHALNQMQLQKLVYIAHGWCLAYTDNPLTGDRPEAWSFGPVYRRLAIALARYGRAPVTSAICVGDLHRAWPVQGSVQVAKADLDGSESDTIAMVYRDYSCLDAAQLATITQRPGTPWHKTFAAGAGERRDIPHSLVRDQFVKIAETAGSQEAR